MGRLATIGWELADTSGPSSGAFGLEGGTNVTWDTVTFRSGLQSAKIDSGVGNNVSYVGMPSFATISSAATATFVFFVRVYYNFASFPAANEFILNSIGWNVVSGSGDGGIKVGSDGSLYAAAQANLSAASATKLTTGTWYMVEAQMTYDIVNVTSRKTTVTDIRINGVSQGLTTNATLSNATPGTATGRTLDFLVGYSYQPPGASKVINIDDGAINDNTGASQNSWPGSGKVVLLKPISDNARGANWTGGAGGTTNLFDAVDNTPPVGISTAGAPTNTSQIKNIAKDTTGNYDANMTTYTSAGIVASDTINVVQAYINHCCTASVDGAVRLVSNPAGNAGADSTFTAISIGGYASGCRWLAAAGQVAYSPSVTLGTSPVLRVGKRQSSARELHIDAMFIYVEYTNAVTSDYVPRSGFVSHANPGVL